MGHRHVAFVMLLAAKESIVISCFKQVEPTFRLIIYLKKGVDSALFA